MSSTPLQGTDKTISPEMRFKLKESLINDEGYEKFPYVDTKGKITIGVGYNLTDRGVTDQQILQWLNDDIDFFYQKLTNCFVWYSKLSENRKIALVNMCFMGWLKFLTFNRMLAAFARQDYEAAAREMLDSKWARDVGDRAVRLAELVREG